MQLNLLITHKLFRAYKICNAMSNLSNILYSLMYYRNIKDFEFVFIYCLLFCELRKTRVSLPPDRYISTSNF